MKTIYYNLLMFALLCVIYAITLDLEYRYLVLETTLYPVSDPTTEGDSLGLPMFGYFLILNAVCLVMLMFQVTNTINLRKLSASTLGLRISFKGVELVGLILFGFQLIFLFVIFILSNIIQLFQLGFIATLPVELVVVLLYGYLMGNMTLHAYREHSDMKSEI